MRKLRQILSPTIALLVALAPSLSMAARTVTADQIKNGAQTQTYTVPTASTTLIGTTEAATVTNKVIDGASNTIVGLGANRYNLMTNGDFESRTSYATNWTASAGSLAAGATTNILVGAQSATWDASASTQTLTYAAITVPYGYQGMNCEVSGIFKVPSGTATHVLSAYDGTNTLVSGTITNSTTAAQSSFYFPCPASGTIQWKLTSAADEPLVAIDEAYIGLARHLGPANYSTSAPTITKYTTGSGTYTPPAGVTRLRIRMTGQGGGGAGSSTTAGGDGGNGTTGSDTTFGTATASGGVRATGAGSTSGGAGGAASLPTGWIGYAMQGSGGGASTQTATGGAYDAGGRGGASCFGGGLGNSGQAASGGGSAAANSGAGGTGAGSPAAGMSGAGGGAGGCIDAWIMSSSTAWASSYSYSVGTAAGGGGTAGTGGYAGGSGGSGYIEITEYYDGAGTVVAPPAQGWYVAANISGTSPDLGVANVTSYTEIVSSALTMTPVSGSQPVAVMCSTTNAATAPTTATSTCAAGSESLGANFNIPVAGTYEVCANFTHRAAFDTIEQAQPTFQLIETPLAAQTLTLEGGAKVSSGGTVLNIATGADEVRITPFGLCSMFKWTSAGNKGVRLMYEQAVTGTPDGSSVVTDGDTNNGQRDFYITVKPVTPTAQAPLLVNSVIARDNSAGVTTVNTVVSKTTTYTATANEETILASTSGGAWTLSLPAASGVKGKKYHIQINAASANALTVDPNSSETVCGQTTVKLVGNGDELDIQSDGTNWIGLAGTCERKERARISSVAAITRQSTNWISTAGVTDTSLYTLTFVTGIFSAAPDCGCMAGDPQYCSINTITTTIAEYRIRKPSTEVKTADTASIVCIGPR